MTFSSRRKPGKKRKKKEKSVQFHGVTKRAEALEKFAGVLSLVPAGISSVPADFSFFHPEGPRGASHTATDQDKSPGIVVLRDNVPRNTRRA